MYEILHTVQCVGEKNPGDNTLIQVCQWDSTANNGVGAFTVVGTAEQVLWDVESVDKFTVTFGKGAETYMKQPRFVNYCKITMCTGEGFVLV